MTNLYFEELMAEFGCKTIRNTAFGAAGGFPYSAQLISASGDKVEITFRFLVDGPAAPVLRPLKQAPVQYIRWKAEEDVLLGTANVPSAFYAKSAIRNLQAAAVASLAAANLAPPHTCPLCGLAGCDTYACLGGEYRETHAACLENRLDLPDEEVTPPPVIRGNYFTGILGALAGAFLGGVPVWALALSRSRVYSALYAFIPIFSVLMYRLLRGKARRNFAGLAVFLSSIAMAFALEQVWYWIVFSAEMPYPVSVWQTISAYFANNTFSSALYPMLLSLAFLIAGFFPAAVVLRQYAAHGQEIQRTIHGAPYVRKSAQPIRPPEEESITDQQNPHDSSLETQLTEPPKTT